MDIKTTEEKVFIMKEQISLDQAEGRAWGRKLDAFGTLTKMASILQKPQDDDFEMVYKEHRLQPFWHVFCRATYDYERRASYTVPVDKPEVKSVTAAGTQYEIAKGAIALPVVEHCHEDLIKEKYVDGLLGKHDPELAAYFRYPTTELAEKQLAAFKPEGVIVVPPATKASTIVRKVVASLIKGISADTIHEEHVEIEKIDLYYRPVYAFQYHWKTKNKDAILECDALTGKLQIGESTFQQYIGKALDPKFLLDVGMDAIDLIIPGGGLAVKLAQKGLDATRKKK